MTLLFRNIIFGYIFRNIISLHCNCNVEFTMMYIFFVNVYNVYNTALRSSIFGKNIKIYV